MNTEKDDFLVEATKKCQELASALGKQALSLRNIANALQNEIGTSETRCATLAMQTLPPIVTHLEVVANRLDMLHDWMCGKPANTTPKLEAPQVSQETIESIMAELNTAIANEEYEKAGAIRTRLDAYKRKLEG